MSQIFKKTLSSIATFTTILWSVGGGLLALPGVASAATISAGDLIKASGPAVYYYATDSKRYVFPNEKTYWSWYSDFSSVKTITDAELAAVQIGGNVTIRPGTKLVKITTDPKVYAVTAGGALHWVESEAIATSLYGSNWARRVVDVSDAFFVNYTVGSSVASAVHPNGSLITMAGSTDKYLVMDGQKRKFASDAAFTANGYKMADVIQTTASYPDGAQIVGMETALSYIVVTTGTSTTPPGTPSGSVMVSLASDTPAGMTVPKNAASVALIKFNLVGGAVDARVTGLKFRRIGVGATSDFSNVYLYDSNGTRLTTGRTINSSTNLVEFNSLGITIPAGQTKSYTVQGDLSNPSSTGGQHSLELTDAAAVVVSGGGTASGSFPVRGNVFTVGNASAARLDVQKGTTPSNPNIGALEAEISNFKLIANTNDIEVRRITLFQAGSITNTDLTDLKLYQGTTLVASAAALVGDKIVLNFNPPYVIANGNTKVFALKAKVAGRASRTINTYVEYTTDVYAIDKVYNAGAAICIEATSTACTSSGANFDGTAGQISVTTQGGQLTVNFNGPATTNVAKGIQDLPLFKFSLVSPDNDLEIRNLRFSLAGQASGGVTAKIKGSSGTEYFRDIKVKNLDTGETVAGPVSFTSGLANGATSDSFTASNSFNIRMGQIMNLAVTADISNSQDGAEFFTNGTSTYKVTLGSSGVIFNSTDVRIVGSGEFLGTDKIVPNTAITGNGVTVKASSLDVALASTPSSATVVKNQSMVPSAAFVFSAGAQSDAIVTALTLKGAASTTGSYSVANLDDVATSCALFDGDTQVGTAQSPDSSLGTMSITNMNWTIPRGTSKTLVAKCSMDSVVSTTFGPNNLYSVGISSITAQDGDSNSITATIGTAITNLTTGTSPVVFQTVVSAGTLTLATDSLRQSTVLVAGGDIWQNFAQFRATAQNEDIRVDRIRVTSTGESANFSAVAIAKDGAVKGWDLLPGGAFQGKDIDLSTAPITVPKNGAVIFQLWGKLAAVQASSTVSGATANASRSGASLALGVAAAVTTGEWDSNYADKFNLRTQGVSSGDRIYVATSTSLTGGQSGNSFIVRKSVPTVTRQSLLSTTLTAGTPDLYKVQVSANAAGSVALKKMVFTLVTTTSTGSSLSLSNFRIRRGSTDIALSDIVITDRYGGDLKAGTWVNSANTSTGNKVVIVFGNAGTGSLEETISGSGNTYTLYATVGGTVVTGDSVTMSMNRTGGSSVVTGYLTDSIFATGTAASQMPGPNINTSSTATDAANAAGTFVWSDLSETPHSPDTTGAARSRDWTDDVYVDDLTASQVVSR